MQWFLILDVTFCAKTVTVQSMSDFASTSIALPKINTPGTYLASEGELIGLHIIYDTHLMFAWVLHAYQKSRTHLWSIESVSVKKPKHTQEGHGLLESKICLYCV